MKKKNVLKIMLLGTALAALFLISGCTVAQVNEGVTAMDTLTPYGIYGHDSVSVEGTGTASVTNANIGSGGTASTQFATDLDKEIVSDDSNEPTITAAMDLLRTAAAGDLDIAPTAIVGNITDGHSFDAGVYKSDETTLGVSGTVTVAGVPQQAWLSWANANNASTGYPYVVLVNVHGDLDIADDTKIVLGPEDDTHLPKTYDLVWNVDGNVHIGNNVEINGTILAAGDITTDSNVTVNGRLYSKKAIALGEGFVMDTPDILDISAITESGDSGSVETTATPVPKLPRTGFKNNSLWIILATVIATISIAAIVDLKSKNSIITRVVNRVK